MKRKHAPLLLLVIVAILAAPAAGQVTELAVTANASPSAIQTGDNVTLTATVEGGVGPYTVTYSRASAGTACSDGGWTPIGSAVSDPPYTVNWNNASPAGSPYAVRAEAVDSTAPDVLRGCDTAGPITVQDPPPPQPQCDDNLDNDNDDLIDFPNDPGCANLADVTEAPNPECSDGIDNDGDGDVDFPADAGCTGVRDPDETGDPSIPLLPTLTFVTDNVSRAAQGASGWVVYANTARSGRFIADAASTNAVMVRFRSPGGAIDDTSGTFRNTYDTLGVEPGVHTVTGYNSASPPRSGPSTSFTVVSDTTAPAEVAVTYTDGNDDNGTIEVTTSDGIDAGAGVNAASGLLERQLGTLVDSPLGPTCINLGAWQQTTATNTIQQLQCALYRYSVSDNVGNTATDTGVAYVWFDNRDRIPPANVTNPRIIFGDHVVKLTYRTPTVDFERVRIFRSIAGVDGSVRLAYNGARRIFTDRSVLNGTRYVYEIVTYDATGNRPDIGVVKSALPRSRFLLKPRDGAILRRPPRLDWKARAGARFYNVKLLRDIGPGPAREVLSKFPRGSALQLTRTWRHKGVLRRYGPGTYYWYVWPRLGARYGKLMGYQQFRVPSR